MRKRSEEDPLENKKIKTKTNKESDLNYPEDPIEININSNETTIIMALKPIDAASLDDSLGAALIRAFDREDVRDKFANIFTDKCQIMIDESTKLTNKKIDEVIETAKEQNNRIVHLERMANDDEQDRRESKLIIKG